MSDPFHLKSGDRVVFYGDSITEQQLYTVFVEAFVRTRFPKMEIDWFNRGWGGDTSWGQGEGGPVSIRASRDVEPLRPTVVTVMMGMNDGGYTPYNTHTEQLFAREYAKMLAELQRAAPSAAFTLMRTSPWDQYTAEPRPAYPGAPYPPVGYNDALQRYGEAVCDLASKHGCLYVDFNEPMVDAMILGKKLDPALATQIVPDWIHPGPAGHLIMAAELLKGWHAPGLVSEVALDLDEKRVVGEKGATVSDWKGLTWKQTDEALPFPTMSEDQAIGFVKRIYPFNESLNQQTLTVIGLSPGSYELRIDGEVCGEFSADSLEEGINLAALDTPMTRQSREVLDLVARRSLLQMTRWRQVEVKYGVEGAAGEAAHGLEAMEKEVAGQARDAAQPVEHEFEVLRV